MGKLGIPAVPRNGAGHTNFDCLLGRLIGAWALHLWVVWFSGWFGMWT
jgi:hypothetical protein